MRPVTTVGILASLLESLAEQVEKIDAFSKTKLTRQNQTNRVFCPIRWAVTKSDRQKTRFLTTRG